MSVHALKIGSTILHPSVLKPTLQDISANDSGRTQQGKMIKNRIAQKWKLELEFWGVGPDDASTIMTAVSPEYFYATFYEPESKTYITRQFYRGDVSMPMKTWNDELQMYETIAFNIIEV